MTGHRSSRRRFLVQAAAVALFGRMVSASAQAVVLKKLTADNPQAVKLHYSDDAATVKDAAFKAGSNCANCQLFNATTGGCQLFDGYSVDPKGWCTSWVQ